MPVGERSVVGNLRITPYYYAKPIKWHLNYPTIVEHLKDFGAKRVILTHMSDDMLSRGDAVPEECAHDGMVVEL
jgi:hypothetical protein